MTEPKKSGIYIPK